MAKLTVRAMAAAWTELPEIQPELGQRYRDTRGRKFASDRGRGKSRATSTCAILETNPCRQALGLGRWADGGPLGATRAGELGLAFAGGGAICRGGARAGSEWLHRQSEARIPDSSPYPRLRLEDVEGLKGLGRAFGHLSSKGCKGQKIRGRSFLNTKYSILLEVRHMMYLICYIPSL